MTDGENKESGTGSTPPTEPAKVWLPPRLRDRLEGADAPPPKTSPDLGGWIAMLLVLALGGGVVWWAMQKNATAKKAEMARVELVRQAAVAESLAQVRAADSLKQVARADSVKAFLALPAWKQAEILSGGKGDGGATPGPSLDEAGKFAIDAGNFLFEDAAQSAAQALKATTKQEVRVVPVEADGATSYHLYVGNFSQRGAAVYAADQLLTRGSVSQAKVVKVDK